MVMKPGSEQNGPPAEQTREAWERSAEAYDRVLTATDMRAAERALELARVGPATRLLDVAAGPGAASIPAARLGADVLAIDYSQAMVNLLNRKARELGLPNLHARLMDGMALGLEDDSFDVACSVLGVMLFPDRARGLSEMARVVRPGGLGAMVVLGPPSRVLPISLFFDAMEAALPGFRRPMHSPLFCLQDPDVLRQELEQAGFRDVEIERFESSLDLPKPEDSWDALLAGAPALSGLLEDVPRERQQAIRDTLLEMIRLRAGSGPVSLAMAFNIAVGTNSTP
jgi:ubiquinone/menaquinone biosynthesis C-methylase UbiE